MIPLLTGAKSPGVCKANTTQSVDHMNVFEARSVIEGQMHSIGFTELARVNNEQYFQPVTPFHPFHGYSDSTHVKKKIVFW